jgi:thiamine transport system ATP-binding protein
MLTLEAIHMEWEGFTLTADCEVGASGLVAVIGPSGGGKSTLLSLISGFVLPDAGRILWRGQDLGPLPPGKRPVAVLFQDNNLFPHLDVLTNVALGLSPQARPTPEVLGRAREALARVGLAGLEARRPGELSGGQQGRAALARTLLTDRPIVLMDEAFSALGPAMRTDMMTLVRDVLPDALILMVTHDPDDARRWAPTTMFVDEGRVHAPVPTDHLFANPPEELRRYLE